ncbi:unnamed protein product, partial [Ixodes persulcatus]
YDEVRLGACQPGRHVRQDRDPCAVVTAYRSWRL